MKLYYFAGACSLSPHITLRESGLPFDLVKVDVKTRTLADGTDYTTIQPLNYVPLLELDDGTRLAEGPAIVQYIADRVPDKRLAPPNGTPERYRLQSWLGFINSELHKGVSVIFNFPLDDSGKDAMRTKLKRPLGWLDEQLADSPYLMGDTFTVADGYLYTVTMPYRARRAGVDLSPYKNLQAYRDRVDARPSVKAALAAEGIENK
ncbi:MAG TPA: glutathione transferase GstA [Burkholderiales bacterium]|nr:glutathione transferase GstA [Burkholderiales bacterium]